MNTSVKDIIRRRKSVRTFSGEALRSEDRQKLEEFFKTLDNPFGVSVEFRFLDAKEHGLSNPVIVGTDAYIAAKVGRVPQSEIAYGYSFEAFCLFAESKVKYNTIFEYVQFERMTLVSATKAHSLLNDYHNAILTDRQMFDAVLEDIHN